MGFGIHLLDLLTGNYLMFPILFVIPVSLCAWFCSAQWAWALAIVLPVGRFCIAAFWELPSPMAYLIVNALVRIVVLFFLAFLVSRTARQTSELEREVRLLEGILPICMFCKRIRDEHQNWQQLESYITQHSQAGFSHGLCPECAKKHYEEFFDKKRNA